MKNSQMNCCNTVAGYCDNSNETDSINFHGHHGNGTPVSFNGGKRNSTACTTAINALFVILPTFEVGKYENLYS